jgi:serine-type D-Ala-D-Ala carboxypeptidase (penicillin-binding protein 5/6)
MQRYILAGALVLMAILVAVTSFLWFPALLPTSTLAAVRATPTPSPTPTPTPSPTPSPTPEATVAAVRLVSTYLVDATTGKVLIDTNSENPLPMASTTKIMTAILAIEHLGPDDQVIIQQSELDEVPPGGYTLAGLRAGDQLSVQSLLYGLLLPSGCDAAIVLAHAVSGNSASFVALMNAKAQALHLTHTHFANPAGFSDPNNYSTAADLTTLARYAMSNSTFATIVKQPNHTVPATMYRHLYVWQTTNQLLGQYDGADGVKTGNSDDGGYCLVFSATRNGHHLIGTIMHDTSDLLYQDAMSALDTGFAMV